MHVYLDAWINSIHFGVYCSVGLFHSYSHSQSRFVTLHSFYCTRARRWCKTPPKRIGAEFAVCLLCAVAHHMCECVCMFAWQQPTAAELHVTQMLPLIHLDCTQHCYKWILQQQQQPTTIYLGLSASWMGAFLLLFSYHDCILWTCSLGLSISFARREYVSVCLCMFINSLLYTVLCKCEHIMWRVVEKMITNNNNNVRAYAHHHAPLQDNWTTDNEKTE